MRCFDTLWGFVVFFVFGSMAAVFPSKLRDAQVFIRSKIPFGDLVPFAGTMQKDWYVTLIRVQGLLAVGFSLFLLHWYLRHCI
jgi:hypothetical protein